MPKRIGGGWLGTHERLRQQFYQALPCWKPYVYFIAIFIQYLLSSSPHACSTRGFLLLLLLFETCYELWRTIVPFLLRHCLDDTPPPWAQAKVVQHITRRHDRKHGRYRIIPKYQTVRLVHVTAFLQCMLTPSPHLVDSKVATAFRHIPWAVTTPAFPFKLEYFDVTVTVPKSYSFNTPTWDSPAASPFCLPIVSTDGLFSPNDDPSEIMHLMNFDLQPNHFGSSSTSFLDKADMPLYFSLQDDTPCFSTSTVDPPLIVDTGASVCISPLKSDFESYRSSTMRIKDLSSSNKVAEVRLLSPQLLLNQAGGFSHQTSNKIHIHLDSSNDDIDAHYCPRTRLPMLRLLPGESEHSFWTSTFNYTSADALAYPTLLSNTNVNLTAAQKEVLLWHHKLSHASISWIQLLMRDKKWLRDRVTKDKSLHSGPFLPCRTRGPTCDIDGLKCVACLCAKAQRQSTHSHTCHDPDDLLRFRHQLNGDAKVSLKRSHVAPGDCVSADHYLSPFNGHLYSSFGRELRGYSCGTIFVDHASGKVFNFPQLSNTAVDTIRSKHVLERLAYDEGIVIKQIHSDNGVFASAAFKADCASKSQKLSFSGVGVHHQNGVAERNIKTISQWARASMLHAAFHWHEHANIKLWPQAVDYAVWVFNRLPSVETGLSPNELWSSSRNTTHDLRRAHPFGCPVFVLDPALQDGTKIPKWDTRARRGMFVGFSSSHSSLVPLVLNITTGKITPQFHVIFDDQFQTVTSLPKGTSLRDEWLNILAFGNDCFLDVNTEVDDSLLDTSQHQRTLPRELFDWFNQQPSTPTPSSPTTFTPPLIVEQPEHIELINGQSDNVTEEYDDPPTVPTSMNHINPAPAEDVPMPAPEGVTPLTLRRNPTRNTGSWKDGPAKLRTCPIEGEDYDFTFSSSSDVQATAFIARRGLRKSQPLPNKLSKLDMLDCYLLQRCWTAGDTQCYPHHHMSLDDESDVDIVSDPRVLETYLNTATSSKYDEDNPSFDMAVNGPFQGEFYEAMCTELTTIADDFKCYPPPGLSRSSDIQMDQSRSLKPASVHAVINNSKA
jgi:transposase InsO family protein